ncbi:MAG TPA: sigma-70 family RNA polymerase sigma factor [Bacteroidetes bacterium]|nr:sigma-70 family RNA polymerase sigma factor [Bacteroidota bacterium]
MDTNPTTTSGGKNLLAPEKWVEDHGDYLYNFAYSRVMSKSLAEDLVQDTFVAALKAMPSFQGKSSEITWLISILKRKVVDHYRKSSTTKEISSSEFAKPFNEEGSMQGHWIMERAPKEWPHELDDPIHRKEFRQILELCLSSLPDNWKAVFVMKVMDEINSDEICKEFGCTPSNLWVMLHRARLKLRECIEMKWIK